ncbi:MAG: acyl-CoA thioesterase [Anaerolineales bacterium]|nr:acyl-CoA thioesterase [Anaerolineales bacterium]
MTKNTEPVEFEVLWADLDINGHVRHTVYGDWAGEARHRALAAGGIRPGHLEAKGVGPVLIREEARYLREIRALDSVRVVTKLAGLSEDHSRWRMKHEIYRRDGELAARITVEGTWLDLEKRRPTVPPPEFQVLDDVLERSDRYETLKSLVRS